MITWDVILVFAFVFLLVFHFLQKKPNLPPGPRAFPVIGNVPQMIKHVGDFPRYLQDVGKKYGGLLSLRIPGKLVLVLTDYDLINQALVKKADIFSGRPQDMPFAKSANGLDGVTFAHGSKWKCLRRFTLTALRDFGVGRKTLEERTQEEARAMMEVIRCTAGKPFQLQQLLQEGVCNIICSIAFGSRYEYHDKTLQRLLALVSDIGGGASFGDLSNISNIMWAIKQRKVDKAFEEIYDFIEGQIKEHNRSFDPTCIRDFVDLHIDSEAKAESSSGTKRVLVRNFLRTIVDLLVAGTETTSTTLSWIQLYMIRYPEIQQKCYEELDKEVGHNRQPCLADRQRCPYIEATLLEIQRLASVVPIAVPHTTLDDTSLGGYDIPKDTFVVVNLYAVHMDPRLWDAPEEFRPERWLDENGQILKKEAFVPFSIGPRACLGEALAKMQIFLFFTSMLQQFMFKMEDENNPPSIKPNCGLVYSPQPYRMRVLSR